MYMEKNAFVSAAPARSNTVRGFAPLYHADVVNHCPACGHTHWHIGRTTAECAFCETALPLSASDSQAMEPLFWFRGTKTAEAAWT